MTSSALATQPTTISQDVYQVLRHHIINQTFNPGQRLQLDELAQQLGVSRTPVQDAIKLLASEGLVKVSPRRGTYVAELTIDDIEDTYEVRWGLEMAAAERLIQVINDAGLEALAALVAETGKVANENGGVEQHLRKNFDFHEMFIQLSGNRKLLDLYRSLNASIQIYRVHYRSPNWLQRVARERQEHQEIVDALRNKDAPRLFAAVRSHLDRAKQSLKDDMLADTGLETDKHAGSGKE